MKKKLYILSLLCLMLGCAERDDVTGVDVHKSPIRISSDYPLTGYQTRATVDGGFVAGDEMGVFVVDYDEEGNPGTMMLQGNRASNIRFTMQDDGSWTAPVQLYWDVRGKHRQRSAVGQEGTGGSYYRGHYPAVSSSDGWRHNPYGMWYWLHR